MPWDVVPVELVGTGHLVCLARVWLDVLAADGVDRDQVRVDLAAVCAQHPNAAMLAAHVARPDHVRKLPAAEQARWLVDQVRAVAADPPSPGPTPVRRPRPDRADRPGHIPGTVARRP